MGERTIGQLASDAGIGVETIRYYQRIGLIPRPHSAFNGWHHYPERTFQLLQYIRQGRQFGFSLRELQDLLVPAGTGAPASCTTFRVAIEAKIAEIDAEITRMRAQRAELCGFVKACESHRHAADCQIMKHLA